jgi:hypothetical protein
MVLAILERMLELDPSNSSLRFTLAFGHSEMENNDLALYHYSKMPAPDRESVAWNNLGVALSKFSLMASSVNAYRMAESMGETLAMSNLAEKFLIQGFVAEAERVLGEALSIKDYHKNVPLTLSRAKRLLEDEEKRTQEILEKTEPKCSFLRQVGAALAMELSKDLRGEWEGPDCVLTVDVNEDKLRAIGTYEKDLTGLASIFAGLAPGQKLTTAY